MHPEALEKVLKIAAKNPRVLLSPLFFEKICVRLGVETGTKDGKMTFSRNGRQADAVIITPENCREFGSLVEEGKSGIRIFEFINALVYLVTGDDTPPSPYEKTGPTVAFYCKRGEEILRQHVQEEAHK
ncbi:MAG: hypothetical protein CVU89_12755 [Firmicutes bacterium HGW-Firmicutes-14]|nr:MAG: hypothetical protein CVU89_12755 [Firmicutes bacterium HGW-Firmicutes-14]